MLQNAGYYTVAIGKWHLGYDTKFQPNSRGFDDFYGFLGGGHKYFPEQYKPIYEKQIATGTKPIFVYLTPLLHNNEQVDETAQFGTSNFGHPKGYYQPYFKSLNPLPEFPKEDYLTDVLTDEAAHFISEYDKKQPFMLSLWYYNVHGPHVGRKDLIDKYKALGWEDRLRQLRRYG